MDKIASVENMDKGMKLIAGPQNWNDAHHMVIWTKQSFKGDLKIEFEFIRNDFELRNVNIIYIQATGSGREGEDKDISKWSRDIPGMGQYFGKMNSYHVSFAVGGGGNTYACARYSPIELNGRLKGSDIPPDYSGEGIFLPGIKYKITIIKRGEEKQEIAMRVEGDGKNEVFYWKNDKFQPITEGRIGIRLMYTRSSIVNDFRISVPIEKDDNTNIEQSLNRDEQ